MASEFIKPKEVATLFEVTPKTIYNWIATGYLKSVRIGPTHKSHRLYRQDVMALYNAWLLSDVKVEK